LKTNPGRKDRRWHQFHDDNKNGDLSRIKTHAGRSKGRVFGGPKEPERKK
jgi:hypothetical protein